MTSSAKSRCVHNDIPVRNVSQTLILGGAGFIGSNLTRVLAARGERPRVLTRPSPAVGNLRDLLGRVDLVYGDFNGDAFGLDRN